MAAFDDVNCGEEIRARLERSVDAIGVQDWGQVDNLALACSWSLAGGASLDKSRAGGAALRADLASLAKIALAQKRIGVYAKRKYSLPGMRVWAEFKTGDRRVMEYILSPFTQTASKAIRE
jgi:hypothetical protein